MSKLSKLGHDLYTGDKSVDFVGRKWLWYAISGVIVLVAVLGLTVKGLNLGIDFTGGTRYTVTVQGQAGQSLADDLRNAVGDTGVEAAEGATVMTAGDSSVVVQTGAIDNNSADDQAVLEAITSTADVDEADVSRTGIGPSWGERVATKAATGLAFFLVGVILFIWAYFREWKMSVAGVVALLHDIVITVGIYAISGFEVTPATVTGFLTILGFSLYDTVVVFDKVKENTRNLRGKHTTYAKAANLALNQTLVRSINTSIVALLPVIAILYVSAVQLGTSSLKDISLVLFVGMAAGTYSSVVIATPLLVHLKSTEKEVVDAERHAGARIRAADRYASVPTFTEDLERADVGEDPDELREDQPDRRPSGGGVTTAGGTGQPIKAMGKGRTLPTSRSQMDEHSSAGRPQPQRKPRSKRGK